VLDVRQALGCYVRVHRMRSAERAHCGLPIDGSACEIATKNATIAMSKPNAMPQTISFSLVLAITTAAWVDQWNGEAPAPAVALRSAGARLSV